MRRGEGDDQPQFQSCEMKKKIRMQKRPPQATTSHKNPSIHRIFEHGLHEPMECTQSAKLMFFALILMNFDEKNPMKSPA